MPFPTPGEMGEIPGASLLRSGRGTTRYRNPTADRNARDYSFPVQPTSPGAPGTGGSSRGRRAPGNPASTGGKPPSCPGSTRLGISIAASGPLARGPDRFSVRGDSFDPLSVARPL